METDKIYNESCLETLKKMPDDFLDLTVTSPPYNIGVDYDGNHDDMEKEEYRKFILNVCSEIYRVSKNGARFCINLGNRLNTLSGVGDGIDTIELALDIRKTGWKLRESLIWVKTREPENPDNFSGSSTAWGSFNSASNPICRSFSEYIFVFHKNAWKKEPVGESTMTAKQFMEYTKNVWYFPAETQRNGHPAPYPYQLPYRCINFYSYVNDIVYDPFTGTGTTCMAAKDLNRRFVGSELSEKYHRLANHRISQNKLF